MILRHWRLLTRRTTRPQSCRLSSTTPPPPVLPSLPRTYSTPLAKHLTEAIKTTGPIPLAAYMRQCLTSEHGGYYTSASDPFGRSGDFITSPEISQLFGEMVGIWVVSEWLLQGRKSNLQLIELGPGRGTLMGDVLQVRYFLSLRGRVVMLIETIDTHQFPVTRLSDL
jgi:NADH dehydrogenase [ubiquinone] 1 alpha subcomplex assembly factor 7